MEGKVDCERVELKEIFEMFVPVVKEYYDSFEIKPRTTREKILAMQQSVGKGCFFAYGGGETEEMELQALEYVFLVKRGLV